MRFFVKPDSSTAVGKGLLQHPDLTVSESATRLFVNSKAWLSIFSNTTRVEKLFNEQRVQRWSYSTSNYCVYFSSILYLYVSTLVFYIPYVVQ